MKLTHRALVTKEIECEREKEHTALSSAHFHGTFLSHHLTAPRLSLFFYLNDALSCSRNENHLHVYYIMILE